MTKHSFTSVVFLMLIVSMLIWACSNDSEDNSTMPTSVVDAVSYIKQDRAVLEDMIEKHTSTMAGMDCVDVMDAMQWLENHAYSYSEENSAVLFRDYYRSEPQRSEGVENIASYYYDHYVDFLELELAHTDTMIWYAFENPTHDSANHTAVVYFNSWTHGERVVVVELDVSVVPPSTIRIGRYENGQFFPGSSTMEGFFDCVGRNAVTSMVGCAVTNCAYFQCVGAGTAAGALVCGLTSLFD